MPVDLAPPPDPRFTTMPEPEQPLTDTAEPLDDYGPPAFVLNLVFESEPGQIEDAAQTWRRALELIESAKAKGLTFQAGQVDRAADDGGEAAAQMEAALAELAEAHAETAE